MSKEISVKYGLIDLRPERPEAKGHFEYILNDISDIKSRYISFGFHLDEFKRLKYYEDFGFESFEEFCEKNVPLDKSAISRCMNVFYEFAAIDKGLSVVRKMWIDEKYKDYSYGQLVEMLPLDEKRRKMVKPDMTIAKIRELKKKCFVPDDVLKLFIEKYIMDETKEYYSRSEVLSVLLKRGSTYNSHGGGKLSYNFKPGKVAINSYDEFYSFAQVLDAYEALPDNKLVADVATSQPEDEDELVPLYCSGQFEEEEFIAAMFDRVKGVLEFLSLDLYDYERSGKQLSFKDIDGNSYSLLFRVSKKKEG